MSTILAHNPDSASVLIDGPAPSYTARLTLAQRIINAGMVRWHFCRFEHHETVELKRQARTRGFHTITPEALLRRRREYLRAVLAHDPGLDPDWWLARESLLETDRNWLLEQRAVRHGAPALNTDEVCAVFEGREAA